MGIDPEHLRDYQLLKLGIDPLRALDYPAHKLDWLLAIHDVLSER